MVERGFVELMGREDRRGGKVWGNERERRKCTYEDRRKWGDRHAWELVRKRRRVCLAGMRLGEVEGKVEEAYRGRMRVGEEAGNGL